MLCSNSISRPASRVARAARAASAASAARIALLAGLAGGLAPFAAQAQMHSDPTLESLYAARKHAELERVAAARIAARPDDAQAVLAFALAALAQGAGNPVSAGDRRKTAIAHAENCVDQNPKAVECHYALGVVLGAHAIADGMLKVAGSAAKVRAALVDAHLLAPAWYPARSALMEFHLQAPSWFGGNRGRALELARQAPQPAQAKLLQARISSIDETSEAVLRSFLDHRAGSDMPLDDDVRGWGSNAAFMLLNKGQAAALAKLWFERVQRERPEQALGPYGIARALAESGAPAEALAAYERSSKLEGAAALPVDYRIGLALIALNRKDEGRKALQRFVDAGRGNKRLLEDAKKRLEEGG